MPFSENLGEFFLERDFAHSATWSAQPGTPVLGIFEKEYADPFGQVQSSRPAFLCPTASVPGIAEGQTLTIDGTVYTVREDQPDGTGLSVIHLST